MKRILFLSSMLFLLTGCFEDTTNVNKFYHDEYFNETRLFQDMNITETSIIPTNNYVLVTDEDNESGIYQTYNNDMELIMSFDINNYGQTFHISHISDDSIIFNFFEEETNIIVDLDTGDITTLDFKFEDIPDYDLYTISEIFELNDYYLVKSSSIDKGSITWEYHVFDKDLDYVYTLSSDINRIKQNSNYVEDNVIYFYEEDENYNKVLTSLDVENNVLTNDIQTLGNNETHVTVRGSQIYALNHEYDTFKTNVTHYEIKGSKLSVVANKEYESEYINYYSDVYTINEIYGHDPHNININTVYLDGKEYSYRTSIIEFIPVYVTNKYVVTSDGYLLKEDLIDRIDLIEK